jgi:hypothetical protein
MGFSYEPPRDLGDKTLDMISNCLDVAEYPGQILVSPLPGHFGLHQINLGVLHRLERAGESIEIDSLAPQASIENVLIEEVEPFKIPRRSWGIHRVEK